MRQTESPIGTPAVAALGRSLVLLEAVLADRGGSSLAAIAASIAMPRATAHRQAMTLMKQGYLRRLPGGQLVAGPRLVALAGMIDATQIIVAVAAPVLHRLAVRLGCVVQLGTLDNDMVTYRIKAGQGAGALFTRVGLQLEAYCTAIGKVLLASLPDAELRSYLANGPFPALTPNTITDASALRAVLQQVRANGFARDDEEITPGLVCLAVPLASAGGIPAALSASRATGSGRWSDAGIVAQLRAAAAEIAQGLAAA